jgi:hypothetical protein
LNYWDGSEEASMDLDEIYREFLNLDEQRYTNTSRMYWHGSTEKELQSIEAHAGYGETVPLAWVSNSFDYAARFTLMEGYVYHIRQTRSLNIWNPRADKDWGDLVASYPEFNVMDARKLLIAFDWLSGFVRAGQMRRFKRDDLLASVQALGYDGVFNQEDYNGKPALGIFDKASKFLSVFDAYAWDEATELWRSVGYPNRAYSPKARKFMSVKEAGDKSNFMETGNERQNFLERPI